MGDGGVEGICLILCDLCEVGVVCGVWWLVMIGFRLTQNHATPRENEKGLIDQSSSTIFNLVYRKKSKVMYLKGIRDSTPYDTCTCTVRVLSDKGATMPIHTRQQ